LKPDSARYRYNLAGALLAVGRTKEAVDEYRETVRIDHQHSRAFYNLGVALFRLGRIDEAIESFREALRVDPDLAEARVSLDELLAKEASD
jgi:tetratricopeptide (TPR) repeat protein